MMSRCYRPSNSHFHRYGGRGITVCDEWLNVQNFVKWCEQVNPPEGTTIDRIDNNAGYTPDNCRFVSLKENQNNRSTNVLLEWNGRTQTIAQWSEDLNIPYELIYRRIKVLGWSVERALTQPPRKGKA